MRYKSKPREVVAFRFEGTPASADAAAAFISENDIENCEVSAQDRKSDNSLALDIITGYSIYTIERGDYIYVADGIVHTAAAKFFESNYVPCE